MSASYLILYQRTRRSEEKLIELPTKEKLMSWMERVGANCKTIRIIKGDSDQ